VVKEGYRKKSGEESPRKANARSARKVNKATAAKEPKCRKKGGKYLQRFGNIRPSQKQGLDRTMTGQKKP